MPEALLEGEHADIRTDIQEALGAYADVWIGAPNTIFGGRSPEELIGSQDETLLRDVLRSALYSGMA